MSGSSKRILIIHIVDIIMILLILLMKGFDKAINYCDAFFIAGLLMICFGGLSFVSNCGAFDIFGYSFKTVGTKLSGNPNKEYQNLSAYVESKKDRRLKEKFNFVPYLLVGGVTVFLSFIIKVLI